MAGKLIILNGSGHDEVTTDVRKTAWQKIQEGYNFYTFTPSAEGGVATLGDQVEKKDITDESELIGIRPLVGG